MLSAAMLRRVPEVITLLAVGRVNLRSHRGHQRTRRQEKGTGLGLRRGPMT